MSANGKANGDGDKGIPVELAVYGRKDILQAVAWRVKYCTPGGADLTDSEALALAQIAMSTGLNPFIGEVWYLPKKGPQVGVRGLRRKGREQSPFQAYVRPMTPEEIAENEVRIEIGDVGYICEVYRHDVLMRAVEVNKAAGQAVIPIKPTMGIGIWRMAWADRGQYKNDTVPHGKSPAWVAKKRAEADALNQAYDVGIRAAVSDEEFFPEAMDDGDSAETAESDWTVLPDTNGSNGNLETSGEDDAPTADEVLRAVVNRRYEGPQPTPEVTPQDRYYDIAREYLSGARQVPTWVVDIRTLISEDPKKADLIEAAFVQQVLMAAENQGVCKDKMIAFIEIVCGHTLDSVTFGEVRVLMPIVKDQNFASKVAELFV